MPLETDRAERLLEQTRRASQRWQAETEVRQEIRQKLGVGPADTPERVAQNLLRESVRASRGPVITPGFERQIGGGLEFDDVPPNEAGRIAGLAVARIVNLGGGPDVEPTGFGTGFLIAPGILLTNNHVLADASEASAAGANFRYEKVPQGIRRGETFELDPDRFFLTSEALDYTLVAVKSNGAALDLYGLAPLIEATGKILLGQPVQIVQHPKGLPKKWAVRENQLVDLLDNYLHYTTDTKNGSSGAPAFNIHWEVVGLHHSGVGPMRGGNVMTRDGRVYNPRFMDDSEVDWIANEGVRASVIVASLREALPSLDARRSQILNRVLAATEDPLLAESAPPVILSKGDSMSQNVFNFTGPVTIHINGGTAAPAVIPAPAPAPAIAQEAAISIDPNYSNRGGYQADFLSQGDVPLPVLSDANEANASIELKYEHFSIRQNNPRRLAFYTAVNIDGKQSKRPARATDKWIFDPRLEKRFQAGEPLYKNNPLDRGHLVRRLDPAWGTTRVAKIGNDDTFHFTNCSPQHERLNQVIWNDLEDYLLDNADQGDVKLTVFTGPVFQDGDPVYRDIPLPRQFWKVAVMSKTGGGLLAAGFVQSQADLIQGLREADFLSQEVRTDQVKVADIEALTGMTFGPATAADALAGDPPSAMRESFGGVRVRRLLRLEDIKLS